MLRALPLFYPEPFPDAMSWVFVLEEERMKRYQAMDSSRTNVYVSEHPGENQQDQKTYPVESCAFQAAAAATPHTGMHTTHTL